MSPRCHILLAEDNEAHQALIEFIANASKCSIVCVKDGTDAVELIQSMSEVFDFVLMDHYMPKLNGDQATKQIREWEQKNQRPHTPIIGLTASGLRQELDQCLASGMDRVINKPFNIETILELIETYQAKKAAQTA